MNTLLFWIIPTLITWFSIGSIMKEKYDKVGEVDFKVEYMIFIVIAMIPILGIVTSIMYSCEYLNNLYCGVHIVRTEKGARLKLKKKRRY